MLVVAMIAACRWETGRSGIPEPLEEIEGAVVFFFSPTCPDCQRVKDEVIPHLVARNIDVEWVDVTEEAGAKRFFDVSARREIDPPSMAPLVIYGDHSLWKLEDMHKIIVR